MTKKIHAFGFALAVLFSLSCSRATAQQISKYQVLAFYSETVEHDHVDFAHQAISFFEEASKRDGYAFTATNNWDDLNDATLKPYRLIMWLDDQPHTPEQRAAFERYMEGGGGWLGFHIAAYNDRSSKWPWFVSFLGGAVFYGNNWPPLPATLDVDDAKAPLTSHLPKSFLSPSNEWYIWQPSPRENKDVKVFVTLDPKNYPIGFKDVIQGGDLPVVWSNTRYRMLYMNMGHGDRVMTDKAQNQFFEDAVSWVAQLTAVKKTAEGVR